MGMITEETNKTVYLYKNTGAGFITIPIRFIRLLEWSDREELFIILYKEKIIITNKRPKILPDDIIDFFKTKLIKSTTKKGTTHSVVFNTNIIRIMNFNEDDKNINMRIENNDLIIKKLL